MQVITNFINNALKFTNEGQIMLEYRHKAESNEIEFDGGKVVKNYSEDRLQILFDEKPAPEMISTLKHNGFRWSPRFKAWQRQLTSNAFYACERVLKISVRN